MNTRFNANGPLIWSAAAVAITAIVLLIPAWSLVMALLTPGTGDRDPANMVAAYLDQHDEQQDTCVARFNGRSVFFEPRLPRQPPPPPPPPPPTDDKPPVVREDPIPKIYTGPSIYAFIDGKVWFKDEKKLGVGEEDGGLKVLSIDAPWGVKVAYQGGEFDVPLFERFTFPSVPKSSGGTPGIIEVDVEPEPATTAGEDEEDDALASADPEADKDAENEKKESGEDTAIASAAGADDDEPDADSAGAPAPAPSEPEK